MLHNEARKLVLEAWDKTHNAREIAKYFSVNESTVYRLVEERARTGSYETRTQMRGRKTILTEKQHHDILGLVQEQPDITMKEIVETLHLPVGDEAVRRFLIKQGYTYKKKSLHAKEQERPRCAEKTQSMDRNYIWCKVSAKYSCGFSNPQISPIIATDRYLDYFTTIMEDRLWQVLASPVFRWWNRSDLSMNAVRAA